MSKYDYYNKSKKPKLFSWAFYFKMLGVILLSFVGLFGVTVLTLYLTGAFDEKRIPPDGIKISQNIDENSLITINDKKYYVPEIVTDSEGVQTFSLVVEDALKSVKEDEDITYRDEATLTDLTIDISDERVVKVASSSCNLKEPIVFEVVKNAQGYIQGGCATITIRSGDGVYGQTSIDIFIDVPVEKVTNNLHSGNSAKGIAVIENTEQIEVNYLFVGDTLSVVKPIYTPSHSSNPTVDANGTTDRADKLYYYTVESLVQQPNGDYVWEDIDSKNANASNKVALWHNSNNTMLTANRTGIFRVSCTTYVTFDDEVKPEEETHTVKSEYTYYQVKEINYAGLSAGLTSYVFDYSMQGIIKPSDIPEIKVYLNTTRATSNSLINLNMMPSLPTGYTSDASKLKSALANVYLTVDATTSTYYQIVGDTTRSSAMMIYPINDGYGEYYYSLKIINKQATSTTFTFNLRASVDSVNVVACDVYFSMKDHSSTLQFNTISKDENNAYGKYLSMEVGDSVVNSEIVKLMKLRVDTSQEGENLNGVDLSKIVQNIADENGATPSYWLIKYYVYLGDSESYVNNLSTLMVQVADNTVENYATNLGNDIYGAEIVNGYFAPQAYAQFEVYAVLMKTDINGEPIVDVVSGTHRYRSCRMFVDVEVQLSRVSLSMFDVDGNDYAYSDYQYLKENGTYYLKVEPDIDGGNLQTDILASYIDKLVVKVYVTAENANKIVPIELDNTKSIKIEHYNSGGLSGYYAQIKVITTQSDTTVSADYVHNLYFEVIYNNESQFGITEAYEIQDTSVRGVTIVAPGATRSEVSGALEITFTASWSSQVHWSYSSGYLENSKYAFTVDVDGENKAVQIDGGGTSISISTTPIQNRYQITISDVIAENQITISVVSLENAKYSDRLIITLVTPEVTFGLQEAYASDFKIENNEVRKNGENSVYNHIVYNGESVDITEIIKARIGDLNVNDMLKYSFESPSQVESYASISDNGVITFVKNPASPIVISVLIQAFSNTLKYIFRLDDNIDISYKYSIVGGDKQSAIPEFFHEYINSSNASGSQQNQIIMAYYEGAYYPTIIYSGASTPNVINLANLFTIKYVNGAGAPQVTYSVSWPQSDLFYVNGSVLTTISTVDNAVSEPMLFTITISPTPEEGGSAKSYLFLLLPNIQVQVNTITDTLVLTSNNLVVSASSITQSTGYQFSFDVVNATVYVAGNYNIATSVDAIEYTITDQNMLDATTNIDLILHPDTDYTRLFTLKDFAGNEFNKVDTTYAEYLVVLNQIVKIQNITFSWVSRQSENAVSYNGIALSNQSLQMELTNASILTTREITVYMQLTFGEAYIESSAKAIINPYYKIQLNLNNSAVNKANTIAGISPYVDIAEQENSVVLYVNQEIIMKNMLKVVNDDEDKYISGFSYAFDNVDNAIRMQAQNNASQAKLIASNYSGTKYAVVKVSYNGSDTSYRINIFVAADAAIWNNLNELDANLGLAVNQDAVTGVMPSTDIDNISNDSIVSYSTQLDLSAMFVLTQLSGSSATLSFAVTNLEAYSLTAIEATTSMMTFAESAKDVVVVLSISASGKRYVKVGQDEQGNTTYENVPLVWTYYFKLQATQTIQVNYPYENDATDFTALYDDDDLGEIGVNGYVRLRPYDELNVGNENGLLVAINNKTNTSIWDQLIFDVEYYNAQASEWQATNIYAVTDKSITMPAGIPNNYELTRIHVTSLNSGVNAYINVRFTTDVDAIPTINYPQETSITYVETNIQYELRDKTVFAGATQQNPISQTIAMCDFDTSLNVLRIGVDSNSGKLYFSTDVTDLFGNPISGITSTIDENGNLVVTADGTYVDINDKVKDFVVRVYMRSDYGFFKNSLGEKISYNLFFGNKITIQVLQTDLQYTIDDANPEVNRIYLSNLFKVVALDGALPTILPDYYSIVVHALNVDGSVGAEITTSAYSVVLVNGVLYIDYNAEASSVPAYGYMLTITLTINAGETDEVSASSDISIFPSIATISNRNGTVNTIDNPEYIACGSALEIQKTSISFTGLDGIEITYTISIDEGFTTTSTIANGWSVVSQSGILEPSSQPNEIVIAIYNGTTMVRVITYYVMIMPQYKLTVVANSSAQTNDLGSYASIYSGTKYDVQEVVNPMYFGLTYTTNGIDYASIVDASQYGLSFNLLNLNGELIANLNLTGENKIINPSNNRIYGELKDKVIEFRMVAEDVLIEVVAKINASTASVNGYSRQSFIIKLNKAVDGSRITVVSNDYTANLATNPIMLTASGVNILPFMQVALYNTSNLSEVYLVENLFNNNAFLQSLTITSTTFDNSGAVADVLLVDADGVVTKNDDYVSSETTVQSISLYMLGVYLCTIYISVPRDFAYTFNSSFASMYANEELDLSLLANSLVDQNSEVLGEGEVTYTLVASTLALSGNVDDFVKIKNDAVTGHQILYVPQSKQNEEQQVTLIAQCKLNDIFYTAKASVTILPKYSISTGEMVFYDSRTNYGIAQQLETKQGGVKTLTDISPVEYSLVDEDNQALDIFNVKIKKYVYEQNIQNIYSINNYFDNKYNAVYYSPAVSHDNLIAGNDVNLTSYLGVFYYDYTSLQPNNQYATVTLEALNVTDVEYFAVSYDYNATKAKLTQCVGGILPTYTSAVEYNVDVVVKARVTFAVGNDILTAIAYGVFTVTIYPTINLSASYTHNAQSVSVFKALKAYNLNTYIKANATNDAFKSIVRNGHIDYNIKLYGTIGGAYTYIDSNLSEYYTLQRYVTIGGTEYIFSYEGDTYTLTANDASTLNGTYNGNSYITYNNIDYDIEDRLIFTDKAIGFSAIIMATYSNTVNDIASASSLALSYFIKIDVMDLNFTAHQNLAKLTQGDEVVYTLFVNANANANKAQSISFASASDYYTIKQVGDKFYIDNVNNIYPVECLITITFTYSNNKTFVFTTSFILQPNIVISNKVSNNNEYITIRQFAGSTTGDMLEFINYTGTGKYAIKAQDSLLEYIQVQLDTVNGVTVNETKVYTRNTDGTFTRQGSASAYYTLSTDNSFNMTFIDDYADGTATGIVLFNFQSGNQTKNIILNFAKVQATTEFSVNPASVTINAGASITQNMVCSYSGAAVDTSKLNYYVSDTNLITLTHNSGANFTITAKLMVTNVAQTVKAYITFVYVDDAQDIFESVNITVNITTIALSSIQTDSAGYPTISLPATIADEYFEIYANNALVTTNKQNAFDAYFNYDSTNNIITPKATYFNCVELYCYRKFRLTVNNQYIIAQTVYTIEQKTPTLLIDGNDVLSEDNNTITLSAGQTIPLSLASNDVGAITNIGYGAGYSTATHGTLTLTCNGTTNSIANGTAQNVCVPIVVSATAPSGEIYRWNINVWCENPASQIGTCQVQKTVMAGTNLTASQFNSYSVFWYVDKQNAITKITGTTVPADAKYLICASIVASASTNIYNFTVYGVAQTYNILLADVGTDTYSLLNSTSSTQALTLQLNGATITSGVTYALGGAVPANITLSGTNLVITPNSAITGTKQFTITATYGGISYAKSYTFIFTQAYTTSNVTKNVTHTMPYNNGVVYNSSTAYNLLNLSAFTYTNAYGTVYTRNGNVTFSGTNASMLGINGNYITSRAYPTFNWTYSSSKISGCSYTSVAGLTITIPLRANTDNSNTIILVYNYTVARDGINVGTTNYSSAVSYENRDGAITQTLIGGNISGNFVFPFVKIGKSYEGWYLNTSGESWAFEPNHTFNYYDVYLNNTNARYNNYNYARKLHYQINAMNFYSSYTDNVINGSLVSVNNTTLKGLYTYEYAGYALNNLYDMNVPTCTINYSTSFMGFIKYKVEIQSKKRDAVTGGIGSFTDNNDEEKKYETYIIPVDYRKVTGDQQQQGAYSIAPKASEAETSNGFTTSSSTSTSGYNIDFVIKEESYGSIQAQIAAMFGVQIGDVVETIPNAVYRFTKNNQLYYVYVNTLNVAINPELAQSSDWYVLLGDNDDSVATGYKIKYENIKAGIYDNNDILLELKYYSNKNDNVTTINSYENVAITALEQQNNIVSNDITYTQNSLNSFTSAVVDSTNTTLTLSKYITKKGLLTTYQQGSVIELVIDRENREEVASTGLTLSFDNHGNTNLTRSGTVLNIGAINMLTAYQVRIAGDETFVVILKAKETTIEHTAPASTIVIDADSYFILKSNMIGTLKIITNGSSETVLVSPDVYDSQNDSNIYITSLNTNVLTVVGGNGAGNRVDTSFVLQDTYVTLFIKYIFGADNDTSFYLDVLIKSSVSINAKSTSVNISSGNGVDIADLYTITQDGIAISIDDLANANIYYYLGENETELYSNIVNASMLYDYAGTVVPLKIVIYVNEGSASEQYVEVVIALNIEENLYQLNVVEDAYSLYAGQSVDLKYVHLYVTDAKGYLLEGDASIVEIQNPNNAPYIINGTTITALNVFKDTNATVYVWVQVNGTRYKCALDLYLLKSVYIQDEYTITSNYVTSDNKQGVYVDELITIENALSYITFTDRFGDAFDTSELEFSFACAPNSASAILLNSNKAFKFGYDVYNANGTYNLQVLLNIEQQGILLKTVTITIPQLLANRTLGYVGNYNATSVITYSSNQVDIKTLFENNILYIVNYKGENVNLDNLSSVLTVQVINGGGINVSSQNNTYILINTNAYSSIVTHDSVQIKVTDVNTLQSVIINIAIKRA